ncbi:MAG: hypothetical protein L3K04_01235 [Thermoplasmata archaeon]|nr:hypothetical protein [Thermoplasmata archaeon]MCI4337751.1 hypothetical protein [Thermoplasmata archaeon]MCI4341310.1 hypothetical protein [Thermoplasmata archaeon]
MPREVPGLESELRRQHTLLQMMAERMREAATLWDDSGGARGPRLRRALEVHRKFLIEVHQADEDKVLTALRAVGPPEAAAVAERCSQEHPRALKFAATAAALLGQLGSGRAADVRALPALFREEAERIERHHLFDEESLYAHLDAWLTGAARIRLARDIRGRDAARADAEGALIAWVAQLHPASD